MSAVINKKQLDNLARQVGFLAVGSLSISEFIGGNDDKNYEKIIPASTQSLIVLFHPYPPLYSGTNFYDYPGDIQLACFAQIIDYHKIVKQRVSELASLLTAETGLSHRWWGVDNHPLPEKQLAYQAKIGFIGRNKLLIMPEYGTFGSLGVLASPLIIKQNGIKDQNVNEQHLSTDSYCQSCKKCIESCPVSALSRGEALDQDKCISALTQKRGRFSWRLAAEMENHFWGCDICQRVCPYNFSSNSRDDFQTELNILTAGWPEIGNLSVKEILLLHKRDMPAGWDYYAFTWMGTRILIRNMLIVLGNNGIPVYEEIIEEICLHPSPVLRYYAYFCLYRWFWQKNKSTAKEFLQEMLEEETDEKNKQQLQKMINSREELIT